MMVVHRLAVGGCHQQIEFTNWIRAVGNRLVRLKGWEGWAEVASMRMLSNKSFTGLFEPRNPGSIYSHSRIFNSDRTYYYHFFILSIIVFRFNLTFRQTIIVVVVLIAYDPGRLVLGPLVELHLNAKGGLQLVHLTKLLLQICKAPITSIFQPRIPDKTSTRISLSGFHQVNQKYVSLTYGRVIVDRSFKF